MGARRGVVVCATSLALAGLALACGRYGPPVRPVASGSASRDSETFDNTPDARGQWPDEAVPYILQGLATEPDSEASTEPTIERSDEPEAEPGAQPGLEQEPQPSE